MAQDVEVRGIGVGGSMADFDFNGQVVDRVRRPPGIAGLRSVAAIYCVNDSMAPLWEPGDTVYFTDARPTRVGDYVIVELHGKSESEPGPAYLKRLVSKSERRVRLSQINPFRDDIYIDARLIKIIWRVIHWRELIGP